MTRDVADHAARVLNVLTAEPTRLADIAHATGLPRRRVEEAIEAIRKAGAAPICSGPDGIWIAHTTVDYAVNVETRRRRAIGQLLTVRGERRLLRRLLVPGQGRLWS